MKNPYLLFPKTGVFKFLDALDFGITLEEPFFSEATTKIAHANRCLCVYNFLIYIIWLNIGCNEFILLQKMSRVLYRSSLDHSY